MRICRDAFQPVPLIGQDLSLPSVMPGNCSRLRKTAYPVVGLAVIDEVLALVSPGPDGESDDLFELEANASATRQQYGSFAWWRI